MCSEWSEPPVYQITVYEELRERLQLTVSFRVLKDARSLG